MLEPVRFHPQDPALLQQELDRFVLAVRRELEAGVYARPRYKVREVTHGRTSGSVAVFPRLGEFVPVNPALGPVDIVLPVADAADAGKSLAVAVHSTANAATLRAGVSAVNRGASSVALPLVAAAYLVLWDGKGWWTVNDA